MAHRICHETRDETLAYVEHLWSNLLQPDVDMARKLETLFAEETDELDLEYGFLSRIDTDEATQYLQVVHGPTRPWRRAGPSRSRRRTVGRR